MILFTQISITQDISFYALFISKISRICNDENIGLTGDFSGMLYKIPVDFQELWTTCY